MINFPNTPTLAQIFTTAGSSWQWDGSKWEGATVASGGPYLLLTGGTLTGQLTVNPNIVIGNPVTSPPATSLVINKAASTPQASTTPLIWAASEAGGNGVLIDIYSPSASANLTARKARGTAAAPTAVQAADTLSNIITTGYGASAYGNATTLAVKASENWSNTAQGSFFAFSTNTPGTTSIVQRATINQGVVIGNPAADPGQGGLVLNANAAALPAPPVGTLLQIGAADGSASGLTLDAFGSTPTLSMRAAINTAASPQPLNSGAFLFSIFGSGYGATAYANNKVGITAATTEAWSDTANGSCLRFRTTLNGTTTLAEAMRIDHNGNVGIGITVPDYRMQVVADINVGSNWPTDPGWAQLAVGGVTTPARRMAFAYDTTNNLGIIQSGQYGIGATNLSLQPKGGSVGIGTTTPSSGTKLNIVGRTTAGGSSILQVSSGPNGADTTTYLVYFTDFANSVSVGSIVRNGTNTVSYATSSDIRLKAGITESKRGLDALMAIKVSDYTMGKTASQGLLAQDVAKVYPEAVHEGGDDPNLDPWMIDYGRLTPLLIKAVQQLKAELEALKASRAADA
jgi:hypothetical protein